MAMTEREKIAAECREVAEQYFKHPGLAGLGANGGTIADLYLTIARLALLVDGEQGDKA